ncbi:MAG: DUF4364 family protein [Butyrivibrio sp.]|nr:DUF4364 family protein [Butyrivibrio sp.]
MGSQFTTLYKMIVLYMLNKADGQLTRSQIYDFVLEKEYTDFITLQGVFAELSDSKLIREMTMGNRTYLELTEEGTQTLEFFQDRINTVIINEINEFFKQNGMRMKNELSIMADYNRTGEKEYTSHLIARENNKILVDMQLTSWSEETAQKICDNWKEKNQDVYQYLINTLLID